MPRGEHTEHHPNRKVDRQSFMSDEARGWMDDPSKAPYINAKVATFSPEILKEFGVNQQDGPLCNNCSDDMGEALEWHDRESIHPSKRVPCVGCGAQ